LREPLAGMKQFQSGAASLLDISAGGLRLVLKKDLVRENGLELSANPRFVVFLHFSESLTRYPDEVWLVARTKFSETDFVTGDVNLGLEFIGEGVADPGTGKVTWRKVVDHTVEVVAQRTCQWHIELYRDKGLV
ncbi:MAG: pilus assembly protein PilZ, partial [Desulfovibrio sp.]|nr:pilus assembly protein PilZ [Desulfovibrio sp.]